MRCRVLQRRGAVASRCCAVSLLTGCCCPASGHCVIECDVAELWHVGRWMQVYACLPVLGVDMADVRGLADATASAMRDAGVRTEVGKVLIVEYAV